MNTLSTTFTAPCASCQQPVTFTPAWHRTAGGTQYWAAGDDDTIILFCSADCSLEYHEKKYKAMLDAATESNSKDV